MSSSPWLTESSFGFFPLNEYSAFALLKIESLLGLPGGLENKQMDVCYTG
jgi:hypothetical protein